MRLGKKKERENGRKQLEYEEVLGADDCRDKLG